MGDHKAAEYWYEKYLTVHPEDMPALLSYAHLLKYNGKYHLAKEVYLLYATADPVGYYFAGTCDYAINNQDRTNTCFIEGLGHQYPGSDISPHSSIAESCSHPMAIWVWKAKTGK